VKNLRTNEPESGNEVYFNFLKKLISHWHYFAICLAITIVIGFLEIKSTNPEYANSMVFLISESAQRINPRSEINQLSMFTYESAIEDEMGIIRSFPVSYSVVKAMNLEVSYFIGDGMTKPEIYKSSPIKVIFDLQYLYPVNLEFEVSNITTQSYTLKVNHSDWVTYYNYLDDTKKNEFESINISKSYNFGDTVDIGKTSFKIILNENFNKEYLKDKKLYFKFNNIEQLVYTFQGNLKVARVSSQSYLVDISCNGSNPELITDYLNTLSQQYLNKNLQKKNDIADKTIDFIDRQILGIADSLGVAAELLKNFRVKNQVMDIGYKSRMVYEQMTRLEDQRDELVVASKYYDYIKEYFENNKDLTDLLAPSAMGVNDQQLQNLIVQLTNKNAERQLLITNKATSNMRLPLLDADINNLKATILENIDYIVHTSNIRINDIDNRIDLLKREVTNLPSIDAQLTTFQRDFMLNDALYTFLLRTRSEAEIARASNSPDYEVVVPARIGSAYKVAPKPSIILLIALFFGLMIPVGILMVKTSLVKTIEDRKDVEKMTDMPVIATISRNDNRMLFPLIENPKSLIAESFRSLRTSLQFFQKESPKQKILVTSTMNGEGKSFVSVNLATAYATSGRKTLLIEYDLRRPTFEDYFGIQKTESLSSFLINEAKLEDIIFKSKIKNLDIIFAGEIPPNPVELIDSENTRNLMSILESIYESIIIDTPPAGIVTDPYLLMAFTDVNLFAVRMNYTNKKFLSSVIKDVQYKSIDNIAMLINADNNKEQSVYYSGNMRIDKNKSRFSLFKNPFSRKNTV
jgi:tyrosine-protein kinase Etk/Wzc